MINGSTCRSWSADHALRMALDHDLLEADAEFWVGVKSRLAFASRYLKDPEGRQWLVRDYQAPSIESRALRKVHCSGRDVGKTAEIEIITAWASVCMPRKQMLIATQHESNLTPLMRRLQTMFERNEHLAPNVLRIRQSPSWQLEFHNGFQIYARIAGPGGVNFQGMHVDWQLVDEAQNMTDDSWNQLYPALNAGGARWVYGVPNGLRNQFYRLSRNPEYEQYHWPSRLNPGFDEERDLEMQYLYGGKEAPGYVHNVLGLHGSPEHSVFNLANYMLCVRDGAYFDCSINAPNQLPLMDEFIDTFLCAQGRNEKPEFYLGCDLGFAQDPSELVVYAKTVNHLHNLGRVRLVNVDYAAQQKIIEALDASFNFLAIGIDNGHSGCAVSHNLMSISADWAHKVVPVSFGGAVEWDDAYGPPIKRYVKELTTEILIRLMAAGEVSFPPIGDRYNQYAGHTYCIAPSGRMVYSKGNDHIIDADRCAIMAVNRHLFAATEFVPVLMPRIEFFGR